MSLVTLPAYATVYWAAPSPTGVDSNTGGCAQISSTTYGAGDQPGTLGSVRRAGQCAAVAGDVVNITPGTYTDYTRDRIATSGASAGQITSTGFKSGTSENVRTIVQGVPGLAKPVLKVGTACITFSNNSVNNIRDYITIRHLICDATGDTNTGGGALELNGGHHITVEDVEVRQACTAGITTFNNSDTNTNHHLVVRNSLIHHTNRCGAPGTQATIINGYGIYNNAPDSLFEYNEWHHITAIQLTSSWPGASVPNQTFRYNYVHDLEPSLRPECWGLVWEGADSVIHNNIMDMTGCGTLGRGLYAIGTAADNYKVYNNLVFTTASGEGIGIQLGSFAGNGQTGVEAKNNIALGFSTNIQLLDANQQACTSGGTCVVPVGGITSNKTTGALTDCMTSSSTFIHKDGSTCIGAGTALSGFAFNGSAPDQGPFETFTCTSAAAVSSSNSVDVTCAMSLNAPILPSSEQTGWVVKFGGVARTTTSAVRLSGTDSVVRITFDGAACATSDTMTIDYTPGNVTDSTNLSGTNGTLIQQTMLAISGLAVNESACGGGGGSPPTTGLLISYALDEGSGTTATDIEATGGVQSGTLTGGATWGTDHDGTAAVVFADQDDDYIAIPYGSGVNPSTQSLTMCFGILPQAGTGAGEQRIAFGSGFGTSQRLYVGWINTKWGIGVQGSAFQGTSEFPAVQEWTHICLRADSGTDTANLFVNGTKGTTADSQKTYTSYTLANNMRLGQDQQFQSNYTGSTIGYFKLWTAALTDQEVLDEYAAWFASSPSTIGTFSQVSHQFQLITTASGSAVNYRTASTGVSVVAEGAVAIIIQTDCTAANCDPISQRLVYSRNGGTFNVVSDVCGADGVCFLGTPTISSVVSGAVTCCVSGALTANDGLTLYSSSAVPSFDLTQNSSVVQRYVVQFTETTPGTTFDFKVENQNGNAFSSYTPSSGARVTIEALSLGVGF